MQSRLGELGLQSIDVGGAGDCFFRSVSHQLHGNSNHHMPIRTAGETKNFENFLPLIVSYVSISLHRRGARGARGYLYLCNPMSHWVPASST